MKYSRQATKLTFFALLLVFSSHPTIAADNELCLTQKLSTGAEVFLTLNKNQLQVFKPVDVNLQIINPEGQPVSGAKIYCSLYIPMFATGLNNPNLTADDNTGNYKGVFIFNHQGNWKADMTINLPDGTYDELSFDISEIQPKKI